MAECATEARGVMARVTLLDECGEPVEGDCSLVVTSGFISVETTPTLFEPEVIEVAAANGQLCASDRPCSQFTRNDVVITFCVMNPDLLTLITGQTPLDDFTGINTIGYEIRSGATCSNFALEVWSDVLGDVCPPGGVGAKMYGYWLFPWVTSGTIGEKSIANAHIQFIVNAFTRDGSGWGIGPYDVQAQDALNTPGPLLTPVASDAHERHIITTIAPPAEQCECQPLVIAS